MAWGLVQFLLSGCACESVGVIQEHVLNSYFRTSKWVKLVTPFSAKRPTLVFHKRMVGRSTFDHTQGLAFWRITLHSSIL